MDLQEEAIRPETGTVRAAVLDKIDPRDDHRDETTLAPLEAAVSPGREVAGESPSAPAEQVANAIREHAGAAVRQGRTEVSLRLDPPELGTIRIHLSATDHTLSARLVVEQEATRQLLENQVQVLRDRLAETGVTLGSFDISRHQAGTHSQGRQPYPEPRYVPPGRAGRPPGRVAAPSPRGGEVDLVA